MKDYIKIMYATIAVRCTQTTLDKKEILKRYLKRFKGIDISKECLNSRFDDSSI